VLGTKMHLLYKNNNNNNNHPIAAATIFILAIAVSSMGAPTAAATTTGNATTTTMTPSSGIELSPEPMYQERFKEESQTPINQTHFQLTYSGNGTLTLPNSIESITTTSTGSGIVSMIDGTFAVKGILTTEEDGSENATTTYNGVARFNMEDGTGKGIVIALFHTNTTGRLAPLNGMVLAGQIEFPPGEDRLETLWEWQSGIPLPSTTDTTTEEPPLMNTTTTNATAAVDTNATAAPEEEGGEEQQQCQLEITTDEETYDSVDTVTITVTNDGDEALEFPNTVLGLEIENLDTDEVYPILSAQVITTLEPDESRTFEFTYEELMSEIGTGTIEASISGEECSASTTFTLAESSRQQ
jgi:hypothetical protein